MKELYCSKFLNVIFYRLFVWYQIHNLFCTYCRLLVGAPLDDNLQPGTNQSGALWKCPLTTRLDDCTQVITDGQRGMFIPILLL